MNKSLFPRPITAILLSVLGAVVGAAVMLFHAEATSESRAFIMTPGFYVWMFLLIVATIVLALSVPVVLKQLVELKGNFRGNRLEIISSCIIMCLLYVVPFIPKGPEGANVLTYQHAKINILLGLGLIVALQAMIGIWLVHAALRTEFKKVRVEHRQVARFQSLRDQLQCFLGVLGTLISLMTLSIGAQRNALVAAGAIEASKMPDANILTMGAYFTVLVALSYLPTYWLLREVGRRICDTFFPTSSITPKSLSGWHSGRKSLEAVLNVPVGAGQSLQSGIAILAPILSGIVSVLLNV